MKKTQTLIVEENQLVELYKNQIQDDLLYHQQIEAIKEWLINTHYFYIKNNKYHIEKNPRC